MEEMGFTTKLDKAFDFIYHKALDHDLIEHEFDHVFIGRYNLDPLINKSEGFKYVNITELMTEIEGEPHQYTEWFKISLPRVISMINHNS